MTDIFEPDVTCENLEARARMLMAQRIEARGFDTGRLRAEWLAEVDRALDDWNELRRA